MPLRVLLPIGSLLALAVAVGIAAAGGDNAAGTALRKSFAGASPAWLARLAQDATQEACSRYHNAPPRSVADAIMAREKASIVYPNDGALVGDWKKGETVAQSSYGERYTDLPARAANGGNCYACHQLDPRELSYGTLGPSLAGYGRLRTLAAADVTAVYERIYNPQAAIACSNMPRFGTNGFLTMEQIRDLVAYLTSPDSPVNR
jgi:L-cysteine S-thiosulfotransferase